jgi:hypothetical protein
MITSISKAAPSICQVQGARLGPSLVRDKAESGLAGCETAGGCNTKIVKQGATPTIPFAAPRPGLVLLFGLLAIVRRLLIRVQLRNMDLLSHVVQAIRQRFVTHSCWLRSMRFPPPFGIS